MVSQQVCSILSFSFINASSGSFIFALLIALPQSVLTLLSFRFFFPLLIIGKSLQGVWIINIGSSAYIVVFFLRIPLKSQGFDIILPIYLIIEEYPLAGVVINLLEATWGKHLLISNVCFSFNLPGERTPFQRKTGGFCQSRCQKSLPQPGASLFSPFASWSGPSLQLAERCLKFKGTITHHFSSQKVQRKCIMYDNGQTSKN